MPERDRAVLKDSSLPNGVLAFAVLATPTEIGLPLPRVCGVHHLVDIKATAQRASGRCTPTLMFHEVSGRPLVNTGDRKPLRDRVVLRGAVLNLGLFLDHGNILLK